MLTSDRSAQVKNPGQLGTKPLTGPGFLQCLLQRKKAVLWRFCFLPVLCGFFFVKFRAVYSFSFILMSHGQIEKKPPALASFNDAKRVASTSTIRGQLKMISSNCTRWTSSFFPPPEGLNTLNFINRNLLGQAC